MTKGKDRLLRAAEAVEKADDSKFSMQSYGWLRLPEGSETLETSADVAECGTPACTFGHYCMLPESPWTLDVKYSTILETYSTWPRNKNRFLVSYADPSVLEHFEIDEKEADELFSIYGCDDATTGAEAAQYIREFVERKWGSTK